MVIAVTHNGPFHADDVFAGVILRKVFGRELQIVRTRDPQVIAEADIAFDVGAEYDAARSRFDHHQRGRAKQRPNGVEYSSAGLVWEVYAPRLIEAEVVELVDRTLVQPIDAIDNGQALVSGAPVFDGISSVSLAHAIASLNPCWNEAPHFDAAYERAMDLLEPFLDACIRWARAQLAARTLVVEAATAATDRVLVLPRQLPWQAPLFEAGLDEAFDLVVYLSADGTWMVQCVPPVLGSFEQKRPLPEAWAGLRDDALPALTGVSDAVFCHPGRYIGGAGSKEGALQLARLALR